MKLVAFLLSAVVGLLGLVFLIGSQGEVLRMVVGGVLLLTALVLVALVQLRPTVEKREVIQRIDLSGDVSLQSLRCQSCNGQLDATSVQVKAGAVFVDCPWCKASYQLEEAPKW
jgi:phage FluMu protein Com